MWEETKWCDRGLLGSYHSRLFAEPQNRCEAQEPRNDYKLSRKWEMRKLANDCSVYFYNPTMTITELTEDATRWIINEVDISVICAEYRASIIEKCKTRAILNSDEELALSHVFLFQEENLQGLREFFDDGLWQFVKIASRQQDPRQHLTEIKSYLRSYKANGGFEKIMHDILYHPAVIKICLLKNNKIEDTHSHNDLDSVIKPFFPEGKKTIMDWYVYKSAWIKKQFDHILLGSKPDFTIRTTNLKKSIELMFAEIKPPNARSDLVNEDLVALGKMMRASLDKSLDDGVDIVICGLHVIGKCYVIDLLYDWIYHLILIGEFRFPEDSTWRILMNCFQVIVTIQDLVNRGATKYQNLIRKIQIK
ncbi:4272_t:CDS:10 [Cetraspora pellucida]|uniref:4272_t:CDS:1 n=1 Tax=Cetraspora pellucida TaxID=1433469 RepID=A0A9N9HCR0_9GLOM|nr:4272_t:CDS:10 [Cetraspora pellucida]